MLHKNQRFPRCNFEVIELLCHFGMIFFDDLHLLYHLFFIPQQLGVVVSELLDASVLIIGYFAIAKADYGDTG
jgi:hypothetical protein